MTRTPPFFPSNPPLLRENFFLLAPSVYSLSLTRSLSFSIIMQRCSSIVLGGRQHTSYRVPRAVPGKKPPQTQATHTHTHILTHPTKTKETHTSLTSLSLSAFRLPPSKRHPSLPRYPLP